MTQQSHPDHYLHQTATKAITRGGRQAADSAAMEAYWLALEGGKSREEAEKIFSKTYQQVLHGVDKL